MGTKDKKPLAPHATHQVYADPAAAATQAVDKIAAARVWLLKEKPFFGVLARALVVEVALDVPAFRLTSDDRLRVNPLVVLEVKFPALCARVAHLCLHAALGALVRRGPREPLRWNVAHDLAVEPLLRAANLAVGTTAQAVAIGGAGDPAGAEGLEDDRPDVAPCYRHGALSPGASAEEYYLVLPEAVRPDDLWCDLADPPPPSEPPPPAGTFTRQDDGEGDEPGDGSGPQPGEHDEGEHDEGEHDEGEHDEPPEQQPEALPSNEDLPRVDARARELQWKIRLAAALEEELASGGKTFGELPAWIDELVHATIEPPPDWSATLQRSISMLTRTDRSFLRPSRRMSALAGPDGAWPAVVSMPGHRVVPAGRLVAVVDTSASIEATTLQRFLGALAAVATAEGFDEVRLVQADAEVTRDETIFAAELLFQPVAITGRGGTDFGPALLRLAEESRREGERFTVIYLTDLEGRFPKAEAVRPLEVLWVVPGKPPPEAPPFGSVIEMALTAR